MFTERMDDTVGVLLVAGKLCATSLRLGPYRLTGYNLMLVFLCALICVTNLVYTIRPTSHHQL